MSAELVRRALETALDTWATTNGLSVAWENVEFEPTVGTMYARAFMLQADTVSRGIGQTHREYKGVFQVNLCMPQSTGPAAAQSLVALLDEAFTTTAPLSAGGLNVWITRPMSAGPAMYDPGLYVVPVSCEYQAHTA